MSFNKYGKLAVPDNMYNYNMNGIENNGTISRPPVATAVYNDPESPNSYGSGEVQSNRDNEISFRSIKISKIQKK